jgi:polyisoprenoid-binding protein YceI
MRRVLFTVVLGLVLRVAVVVAVLGGLVFGAWYFFVKGDPDPRATITETPLQTQAPGASALDGSYVLESGGTHSFVGYRVTEKLVANVAETTATGRTNNVSGTFAIAGTTVSSVTVTADLRGLKSDNSFRDGRIHSSGLESDRFPEGKFVLADPITLPKAPAPGETVTVAATGDLTLHGVTRRVTITIEGRWDGRDLQIVGRLPIVFGDFAIKAPTAFAVASVDDHAEMEFQLFFTRR